MAKKVRKMQKNTVMQIPTVARRHPAFNLRYTLQGHTSDIHKIALSLDGHTLASSSRDGTVCIWDIESGDLLHTLNHGSPVISMAWSPNGEIIASGTDRVHLWNAKTGKRIRKPSGRLDNIILNLAWWSNTLILASLANGGTYRLDTENGLLPVKSKFDFDVGRIAWSPNEETLAITDNRIHEVLLWNERKITGLTERPAESWKKNPFSGYKYIDKFSAKSTFIDPLDKNILEFKELQQLECDTAEDSRHLFVSSANMQDYLRDWTTYLPPKTFSENTSSHLIKSDVNCIVWSPDGKSIAIGLHEGTIQIWNVDHKRQTRVLETHIDPVVSVCFINAGKFLASLSEKGTLSIWQTDTWTEVMRVNNMCSASMQTNLVFNLMSSMIILPGENKGSINVWNIDLTKLQRAEATTSTKHYVNAKTLLVGDTGVGKTGLGLVLTGQPFKATDSTPGRHVWTFDSQEIKIGNNITQTRETLLWDLAGQPGYRVIHQLHLNEVAVALVVFDARSETDPLSGVRHWERALRLAQQRQGNSCIPMKKFLISARNDRGGVSIGEERLQVVLKEFGFDGYFKTSAKEGWQVKELRASIEKAIPWEDLPEVSSSQLFADIKSFLLDVKNTGRLLAPAGHLYDEFTRQNPDIAMKVGDLRDQFFTCIGRLENRDLIRRLSFGGYVLLQPELLDAYASAMVNTAKDEPDGLGSLAEEIALTGKFFVPEEQKIKDLGQEQLLLHATVEELVRHDLALRENANDGRYLVFPSQFNRDYEDAPEPKGKALAITFDGPVQSLYATLAVRLGHSGLFTTGRAEMWRNAAVFAAKAGGKCGIFLHEFAEARGRLILFFDEWASPETQFHFEEFVVTHTKRHALDGTVELVRFFVCSNGHSVPDDYVKLLFAQGKNEFICPCGATVSLVEPKERIHFPSEIEAMDKSADHQRDFDAFVMSAKGETSTSSFQEWAGGERVTLAIVFTDVVSSTALGEELRDESMNEVRRAHFAQSRKLIGKFNGREIKTIGDSFMAAFKSVDAALDYATTLQNNTGHPRIKIRAGIHIGPMQVEESDVFGGTVNFAARVVHAIKGAEIWLSDRAKGDIDRLGAAQHKRLGWERHEDVTMKGFPGVFTLWSIRMPSG